MEVTTSIFQPRLRRQRKAQLLSVQRFVANKRKGTRTVRWLRCHVTSQFRLI